MLKKDDVAFIIGNGRSRSPVDLKSLRKFGTIYGCNALYRDFEPDWLIAIDPETIAEIEASSFPKEKFIIPHPEEQFEPAECNRYRPRSNAGMNAMLEAIRHGKKHLFCFGMDFIWKDGTSTSNMYEGSLNYGPETKSNQSDNENRIRFLEWIALRNKDITFYLVYPEQYFDELQFHAIASLNIKGITFSKFREMFRNA